MPWLFVADQSRLATCWLFAEFCRHLVLDEDTRDAFIIPWRDGLSDCRMPLWWFVRESSRNDHDQCSRQRQGGQHASWYSGEATASLQAVDCETCSPCSNIESAPQHKVGADCRHLRGPGRASSAMPQAIAPGG